MDLPRADRFYIAVFIVLTAGFLVGISQLMVLRFERGDAYPAYSSLRSDPLGTRGFYDSLDSLAGIRVTRNLRPFEALTPQGDATLFIVGAALQPVDTLPLDVAEALDDFMASGGRVVIALLPATGKTAGNRNQTCKAGAGPDPDRGPEKRINPSDPDTDSADSNQTGRHRADSRPSKESRPDGGADVRPSHTTLKLRWGIATAGGRKTDAATAAAITGYAAARAGGLPRVMSWHSKAYFKDLAAPWNRLYTVAAQPVMVERAMGKGSLVMATDSYFISNEALKSERLADLLIHLIGKNTRVIVDETHHGLRQRPGVMGYLRRHRLHWIVIALLAVAALFVWRNAVPLVPPRRRRPGEGQPAAAQTRNAAHGLTNLLRRNILPGQLLAICFEQWERAFEKNVRFPAAKRERARRIIEPPASRPATQPDPVSGYRAICRHLSEDSPHE